MPRRRQVLARALLCFVAPGLLLCGCKREAPPAFDLPALMGPEFRTDVESLTAKLGAPQGNGTNEAGLPTRTWSKGGATLTAAYKAQSKRVVNVSIIARADDKGVRDDEKTKLLRVATLPETEGGTGYTVEWIESPSRATFSTGFRVVPTPKSHTVKLRISGSQAFVDVAFLPTVAAAAGVPPTGLSGGVFTTGSPWETTLENISDDAKVALQSRIVENLEKDKPFTMRLQIEVDGQVVRDETSKGLPIRVEWEI